MANLKEIRQRVRTVITTQQMTRAMKMVSAAKLGRAQKNIERMRPYSKKLQEIMANLTANMSESLDSPYSEVRPAEKVLLVAITSNRGLCGGFNVNLCKEVLRVVETHYSEQKAAGTLTLLTIGRKGYEFFKRRGFNILADKNHDVFLNIGYATVEPVASMVMEAFKDGEYDRVDIVYNEFKNVALQIRRHEQFLPVEVTQQAAKASNASSVDYIFEPNRAEIVADLLPKSLRIQFYRTVLESNAGEQGARMMAMDSATTNAEELLKSLRLTYNRARQAAITTEILEIVAGAEALAASK